MVFAAAQGTAKEYSMSRVAFDYLRRMSPAELG